MIDLSKLKWLKNIKQKQPLPKIWAYDKLDEMLIPEARIFHLHWHNQNHKANAQQPLKGDLVALVQQAKVTHIVEMQDDIIHENPEKEWSVYRKVKAIWMPPEGFNWHNLPHQKDIFGIKDFPPNGRVYEIPTNTMYFSEYWKEVGGLQGFQQNLSKLLTEIS